MQEDLQQAIDSGILTSKAASTLERLAPGAFCEHKSWGFGRVAQWDLLADRILVDFQGKKNHAMQAAYATETLRPIPDSHILARKASDPEGVKRQAGEDPVALVRGVLGDLGGTATVERIGAALAPEVFEPSAFRKWWGQTQKKLKADGCFQLPTKKSEPVVLLEAPVSQTKSLLEKFRGARFMKDQISAVDSITRSLDDFSREVGELGDLAGQIEAAARKGSRLQAAQALELLLARDEILARHEALGRGENAPQVADILRTERERIPSLFAALPAAKQKRALEHFPAAFGDRWVEDVLDLAKTAPARLLPEIVKLLERNGQIEAIRNALTRWLAERSISSEALIWICKERGANFPELFNANLLNAVFSALERDMLAEKRTTRLHDLLLDDRDLLGQLLSGAGPDAIRDAMRRLMLTPVYDDLNKRSLLGRIIKLYPDMQSMLGGDRQSQTEDLTLTVSWASLESRKAAHEHLVNVEIPQNTRDIATAREQGDLRENFGFKAAKEQQRVLMRRRAEAEQDLVRARGTNFENPDTTRVSIGTVVKLRIEGGGEETYAILGAWDSAPAMGIVSYKAGIGQALLGKRPGERVELAGEDGSRAVEILDISSFTDLELLEREVHKLPAKQG
jgi:transcription elongation GreA/GreB family factor